MTSRENGSTPWPSNLELELRAELLDIAEHQRRQDRLIMELQLEMRRAHREIIGCFDDLKALLVQMAGNGHG